MDPITERFAHRITEALERIATALEARATSLHWTPVQMNTEPLKLWTDKERKETPIPTGVYWRESLDIFNYGPGHEDDMGRHFYRTWWTRRAEFPTE